MNIYIYIYIYIYMCVCVCLCVCVLSPPNPASIIQAAIILDCRVYLGINDLGRLSVLWPRVKAVATMQFLFGL